MSERRPTKRERREEGRRQREELARQQRRRDSYRRAWIAIGVVAVVAVVASLFLLSGGDDPGSGDPPAGVENFEVASRSHVQGPVDYPQDPPVGGDHAGVWLNCGAYDFPVPNENAVHSMEHGAVWITYSPDLPVDQVRTLEALADQGFVVVSPYLTLEDPVVASSWGHQLRLQSADDPRLEEFIRAFRQGPDTPELGAACTGGITPEAG
jgi:hypothetical protein